ncbi:MAG: hypothetical protein VYB22_07840, partial [Pseudomonadota bacterium]|nr:hypothetical protein [Pseudomonadota bacterium]
GDEDECQRKDKTPHKTLRIKLPSHELSFYCFLRCRDIIALVSALANHEAVSLAAVSSATNTRANSGWVY